MICDITNQRFGRLVAISRRSVVTDKGRQRSLWFCRCDCGGSTEVDLGNLRNGHVKSCGCLAKEHARQLNLTHGLSHTPEFGVWSNMIQRCTNPNNQAAHNYGLRGISVCPRWMDSFEAFYVDMGPRPSDQHSIERRDVDGNYEPSNCYWATADIQASNRRNALRVTYRGRSVTLMELSKESGVPYGKLLDRIQRYGYTAEEAVLPDKEILKYTGFGKSLSLKEWAVELGVNYYTLYDRMQTYGSIEKAMSLPIRGRST